MHIKQYLRTLSVMFQSLYNVAMLCETTFRTGKYPRPEKMGDDCVAMLSTVLHTD